MVEKEYTENVKEIYREIEIVYKDTNETEIETVSTRRFQTRGGKKRKKQTDESHKANLFTGNKFFFLLLSLQITIPAFIFCKYSKRDSARE